ncbi:M20 family metallopeptidase [Pasteurellaceae bacterium USgator11]|nr:M20 family metallopeptidase [Pasteurellaceae bacterium UScroc12]TNG96646.1 M20 family metallopeptidase [Pasteurellaceae bacterium USgator41]TNG98881.1 M20 family metallopeptidase [Pasteurellaceae bacterium UScroc31]TNG99510.1 M20 family metallopeptidase [Pasteurellaceae bacterium USgator11]
MQHEELPLFLDELKQLTDIESPSHHIEGINQVADWFIAKAKVQQLAYQKVAMQSNTVAEGLFISNNLEAEHFDILFIAHMDTVFPVGTLAQAPFCQQDDRINALGVIDDKAGALMALYVIKALDLNKLNVGLYLNSHEEIGSLYAKESIREYARKSAYCFVMEPAREDGSMVATRKGVITYAIDFHGLAAHAGNNPERGRSALVEAANFVLEFSKLNDFSAGHTFNCIITNGGVAQNIVPDFAALTIEMRYRLPASVAFFEQRLAQVLENPLQDGVRYEKRLVNHEAPMIDEINLPKIKLLFAEVGAVHNMQIKWVDAGGVSDGNIASSAGCPTIDGLGPTGGDMHMKTEYMQISSVVPKCNLIIDVIKRLFS